jgi:hypothetical protein
MVCPTARFDASVEAGTPIYATLPSTLPSTMESEMKRIMASLAIGTLCLTAGAAFAGSSTTKPAQNPTTGHRGAPTNTCGSPGTATPGAAATALGSPFNPSGTAGTVYAGNPGTASLANSNSTASVAQYDVACFQAP